MLYQPLSAATHAMTSLIPICACASWAWMNLSLWATTAVAGWGDTPELAQFMLEFGRIYACRERNDQLHRRMGRRTRRGRGTVDSRRHSGTRRSKHDSGVPSPRASNRAAPRAPVTRRSAGLRSRHDGRFARQRFAAKRRASGVSYRVYANEMGIGPLQRLPAATPPRSLVRENAPHVFHIPGDALAIAFSID